MRLRTIALVYDSTYEELINSIGSQVQFDTQEIKADYISVVVLGLALGKELIESFGIDYRSSYMYRLVLFRGQTEMDFYGVRPGRIARNLIRKFVKEEVEPFEEKVRRPKDFMLSDKFRYATEYSGYWVDIDMNSAEPYYVTQVLPELKQAIHVRYALRQMYPVNKLVLNAINGNLRNMYVSKYKLVCQLLFDKMMEVCDILESYGIEPFMLRRDGIIARLPFEGCPIPAEIPVGTRMGEFKVVRDHGKIWTSRNDYNFTTNMKHIMSKQIGVMKKSPLDDVKPIFNKLLGVGLKIIKESR